MVIGIDIGTTGTKALLIDEEGRVVTGSYSGYATSRLREGYAEQNPEDWYRSVCRTVRDCIKEIGDVSAVKAVSTSTQGATMVAVDSGMKAVAPAITWQDTRAVPIAQKLRLSYGDEFFYKNTGWKLTGCNLLSTMWLRENHAESFRHADKFLSVNEYINYRLTGRCAGEYTNAGITQTVDVRSGKYLDYALELMGTDAKHMAELVEPGTVIGRLSPRAADDLGLAPQTLVVAGGYDQYCAAVGIGACGDGDVTLSTGTAWVVTTMSKEALYDPRTYFAYCRHLIPEMWAGMATLTSGGPSLSWFMKLLGISDGDYAQADALAAKADPGSGGVMLLPFFEGSTCPFWKEKHRATLFGLSLYHERSQVLRAVMEGVAFQIRCILDSLPEGRFNMKGLRMGGGAAKSRLWRQIVADILQKPVRLTETADTAALGAGMLAAVGAGTFPSLSDCIQKWVIIAGEVAPRKEYAGLYDSLFAAYRSRSETLDKSYGGANDGSY